MTGDFAVPFEIMVISGPPWLASHLVDPAIRWVVQ